MSGLIECLPCMSPSGPYISQAPHISSAYMLQLRVWIGPLWLSCGGDVDRDLMGAQPLLILACNHDLSHRAHYRRLTLDTRCKHHSLTHQMVAVLTTIMHRVKHRAMTEVMSIVNARQAMRSLLSRHRPIDNTLQHLMRAKHSPLQVFCGYAAASVCQRLQTSSSSHTLRCIFISTCSVASGTGCDCLATLGYSHDGTVGGHDEHT